MTQPQPAPLIHFLVPVYGRLDLLADTLRSLLIAIDREIASGEAVVTVVDDAWPHDDTGVLVQHLAAGRFEFTRNAANLGLMPNLDHCIELSRGEYTVILGSDDLLEPNFMADFHTARSACPDAFAIQLGVVEVDAENRPLPWSLTIAAKQLLTPLAARRRPTVSRGRSLSRRLAMGDFCYFPSVCWRTSDLRDARLNAAWGDVADWDLLLRLAAGGGAVCCFTKRSSFRYRRHVGSASEQAGREQRRAQRELALAYRHARQALSRGWIDVALLLWISPLVRINQLRFALRYGRASRMASS